MDRAAALAILNEHCPDQRLARHCLAAEAVLMALARRLGQDPGLWGLAGLLHDLDYDQTAGDMASHGRLTRRMLEPLGVPAEILEAIEAHNAENLGLTRDTPLDIALTCGETITGLVMATAMVYPDKKLASVKPGSVVKRMKEKAFAASVNRGHILLCQELGITLNDFAALAVSAMQEISDELGL